MPITMATRLPLVFFLRTGIQQHDCKDKQHHDGAGIDDHLHGGDELCPQQQIFSRQRRHHRDQRQRGVNGMRLRQQVDRPRDAHGTRNRISEG